MKITIDSYPYLFLSRDSAVPSSLRQWTIVRICYLDLESLSSTLAKGICCSCNITPIWNHSRVHVPPSQHHPKPQY